MKLRNQVLGLGLLGVVMTALVGGAGLINASRLSDAFDESINVSLALSKSQEADMMHDAIRGDVLLTLLAAQKSDAAGMAEAEKGLKEHAENFTSNISAMQALPISPEVRAHVAKAAPLVKAYVDSAANIQGLARKDLASAEQEVPKFQKAFADLEVALEAQSEAVAKNVEDFSIEVHRLAVNAKIIVGAGLAIAAAVS